MTPEHHKLERAKAIAEEIIQMAEAIAKHTRIAFPPKRLFRKKGKRPLKRLKRQRAMLAMGMLPAVARMRMLTILAQPIPNYVPGGVVPGGLAIVGEDGPEMIIKPGGFQTCPIGNMHHMPINKRDEPTDQHNNTNV
jgi:hypothetical protein